MPSFPQTLIGLGPFADLGCKIVFTKTAVTVFHPDGHPILAGWRDETGPRLWHFPLTAEAAQIALNQVPISLTAEAAYEAVDTALHPPQLSIPPVPQGNDNGGGDGHEHVRPLTSNADMHPHANGSHLLFRPIT
jgi:hypothetical protein